MKVNHKIDGVLETSLYVEDLDRSTRFYQSLFGFDQLVRDDRLCALSIMDRQVLLLFKTGASSRPGIIEGGVIPPHDGRGDLHLAFAVQASELKQWEQRLADEGIGIESRVKWDRGGESLYFRDPDNHSIELATPGTWSIF